MITNCSELTLKDAIKIVCYKRYELLGKGTKDEQIEAFTQIWDEFCRESGNHQFVKEFELKLKIYKQNARILAIQSALFGLHESTIKDIESSLKQVGYNFDFSNIETLQKNVERLGKAVNQSVFQLKLLTSELEQLQKDKGSKETREGDFYKVINYARKNGYSVNVNDLNFLEYALIIKDLSENGK